MVKLFRKVEGYLPGVKFVGGKASIGNVDMVLGKDGKSIILFSTKMWNVQGKLDSSMNKLEVKQTMRRIHESVDIYYKLVNDKRMSGVEIISTLYINREFINTVVRREGKPYKLAFRDIANVGTPKFSATEGVYDGKKAPRFKNVYIKVAEAAKAASKYQENDFDFKRFGSYIDLVESLRPTYKGLREYLRTAHKAGKIIYKRIDLSNKENTLGLLIQAARRMSLEEKPDRKYPEVVVDIRKAINTVNKIKEERKESASAGSSLPSQFQVEKYKGERK